MMLKINVNLALLAMLHWQAAVSFVASAALLEADQVPVNGAAHEFTSPVTRKLSRDSDWKFKAIIKPDMDLSWHIGPTGKQLKGFSNVKTGTQDSGHGSCLINSDNNLVVEGQGTSGTWTGLDFHCSFDFRDSTNCEIHVDIPFKGDNSFEYSCANYTLIGYGIDYQGQIAASGHDLTSLTWAIIPTRALQVEIETESQTRSQTEAAQAMIATRSQPDRGLISSKNLRVHGAEAASNLQVGVGSSQFEVDITIVKLDFGPGMSDIKFSYGGSGCGADNGKCSCTLDKKGNLRMQGQGTSGTWTGLDFTCEFNIGVLQNCGVHVDIPFYGNRKLEFSGPCSKHYDLLGREGSFADQDSIKQVMQMRPHPPRQFVECTQKCYDDVFYPCVQKYGCEHCQNLLIYHLAEDPNNSCYPHSAPPGSPNSDSYMNCIDSEKISVEVSDPSSNTTVNVTNVCLANPKSVKTKPIYSFEAHYTRRGAWRAVSCVLGWCPDEPAMEGLLHVDPMPAPGQIPLPAGEQPGPEDTDRMVTDTMEPQFEFDEDRCEAAHFTNTALAAYFTLPTGVREEHPTEPEGLGLFVDAQQAALVFQCDRLLYQMDLFMRQLNTFISAQIMAMPLERQEQYTIARTDARALYDELRTLRTFPELIASDLPVFRENFRRIIRMATRAVVQNCCTAQDGRPASMRRNNVTTKPKCCTCQTQEEFEKNATLPVMPKSTDPIDQKIEPEQQKFFKRLFGSFFFHGAECTVLGCGR